MKKENLFAKEKSFIKICQNSTLLKIIPKNVSENNPKISLIIPLFNSEKFFLSTLRSIQNQDFEDYEIILINDASVDHSLELIKNEAKKDKRIKILSNNKNRGILYSKILAFKRAKGKYVFQMDHDDAFCNNNALRILFEIAEKEQVEILHFSTLYDTIKNLKSRSWSNPKIINKKIIQPELKHFMMNNHIELVFWNKLYKNSAMQKAINLIDEKDYSKHICQGDDNILSTAIFNVAKSYIGINDYFYFFNNTALGASRGDFKSDKILEIYTQSYFQVADILYKISFDNKPELTNWLDAFPSLIEIQDGKIFKSINKIYEEMREFCKKYQNYKYAYWFLRWKLRKACNKMIINKNDL